MIPIFEAAWEIHSYLMHRKILYVIIGGVAVQKWGEPRVTNDVDLTISVPTEHTEKFINQLAKHFKGRVSDLQAFARRTRVIPIFSTNNCGIDISLALPGYEDSLLQHATFFKIAAKRFVRVCSAEDLIIHKATAGRPKDLLDLQNIIFRQAATLDVFYIRQWLKEFALLLESEESVLRFENAWKKWNELSSVRNPNNLITRTP